MTVMRRMISLARLIGSRQKLLCRTFLVATVLASLALAGDDTSRLHSLTRKVFCNCGCGEILAECSHIECKARMPLKEEIASSMRQAKTDDEILAALEKKYGPLILAVPIFRGFNTLLWIVPIAGGILALAVVVWRRWQILSRIGR